jgi:hypothetical protein
MQPLAGPGREHDLTTGPGRLALDRRRDQLADEQGVAPAEAPGPVEQPGRGLGAEHRQDQRLRGVSVERADVDPGEQLVLPQGGQAGWQLLAGADAGQHPAGRLRDHQVQERHRHVVEQVGVVDGQEERAVAGALAQPGQGQVEQVAALVGLVARRQQVGHRPERDGASRLGGPDPLDRDAPGLLLVDHLADQPGLAHAGLAEQDDTPG